ncbi:hypothetical protein ACEUBB_10840 [Aeromonas rivipollensis]|uniref:hypothetical protein n=1 Tax=Aeromonas rivipollensis TaxID=948519 RepID=UPI0038D13BEF
MQQRTSHANDDQRTLAIKGLRIKLNNTIEQAVSIASQCGYWDLLGLCYVLKFNRLKMIHPSYRDGMSQGQLMSLQLNEEALKYAISLVTKHGDWKDEVSLLNFDITHVNPLQQCARHINALFEAERALDIAEVHARNENGQQYRLDLVAGLSDASRALYFHFGLRIERYAKLNKDNALSVEALIVKLLKKYSGMSDLFESESGISLENYSVGLLMLHQALLERLKSIDEELTHDANSFDPNSLLAIASITRAMIFTDTELEATVCSDFIAYLRRHSFDTDAFSDKELRFHYLTRRPFLIGNGFTLVSPELVFDSVMDNTHYTLLESEAAKAEYKIRNSGQFIDDVVAAAGRAGYQEKGRDIWLKEGRKDIGDIDLVLQHPETGHTLLVECKNHTLPLAVYFCSSEEIDTHIQHTLDWEKKVQGRIKHLEGPHPDYLVEGEWDYVIVTHMPEPLAHISPLLIMTTDELKQWLAVSPRARCFSELYRQIYETDPIQFSASEMDSFVKDKFTILRAEG